MSQMSVDNQNQSNDDNTTKISSGWVWGGDDQTSTDNADTSHNPQSPNQETEQTSSSNNGGAPSIFDRSVNPTPVKNVQSFRWGFTTTDNTSTDDQKTTTDSQLIQKDQNQSATNDNVESDDTKTSSRSDEILSRDNQETSTTVTFGVTSNPSPFTVNTSNGTNAFTFGVSNDDTDTNNNANASNGSNGIGVSFGVSSNDSSNNTENNTSSTFGFSMDGTIVNTNDDGNSNALSVGGFQFVPPDNNTDSTSTGIQIGAGTGAGFQFVASTNTDSVSTGFQFNSSNNDNESTSNTLNTGWSFGGGGGDSNTADSGNGGGGGGGDPFAFQPVSTTSDPFAQFRAENALQVDEEEESKQQNTKDTEDADNNKPAVAPPAFVPPVINAEDIDMDARNAFLAMYHDQHKDQWECPECSVWNPNSRMICAACENGKNPNAATLSSGKKEEEKVEESKNSQFEYFDKLEANGELLEYDAARHPKPQYWPYQHIEKEEELEQEGPEAWIQFEDDEDDISDIGDDVDDDDDMNKDGDDDEGEEDDTTMMTKVYAEYKKRRSVIKSQISQNLGGKNRKKGQRIYEDDVVIAIAGDGSMSGALGVGNGNVTSISSNIASFPFLMTSLLGKRIKCAAAGIMSTAVVTQDDELYVWGLNDKSELTINPHNLEEVDVGCDDDQLSSKEGWKRLFRHYEQVLTAIYQEYNPSKIHDPSKPRFVQNLLEKRKIGKLFTKFNGKSETHNGIHLIEEKMNKLAAMFEQRCRVKAENEKKKIPKKAKLEKVEEVDITASAEKLHELYLKVCTAYNVPQEERLSIYIPKATAKEMLQRKNRKLNPYKYLNEDKEDGDSSMTDLEKNESGNESEKENGKNNDKMEMEEEEEEEQSMKREYEYHQQLDHKGNVDKRYEDAFQGGLACSYWTPAHIRLPTKMVIKQVTLGGTHMVVLDNLGRVFSSGTFSNDGPIGHHFDEQKDEVIRYQRELKQITNIEFIKYGESNRRAANQTELPRISAIASGANHILMLDEDGMVWQMGAVKLGQRWCERNIKKYLCPQRISLVNDKARKKGTGKKNKTKKVVFKKIACGNHHNLAISSDGQLYSWGQNVWIQCGHPKTQSGHGDVIDTPRWVPFYKTKQDVNDEEEENEVVDYRIIDVVAGEHMTVALDSAGNVWTCGRNACYALGRKTRSEGVRVIAGQQVKTEVLPDLMRKVTDLEKMHINWIGSGSVVWFAHSSNSGAVYSFGDASSGRAGIGQWKYARGRPVFDEHNLDLMKFEVTSANGGSDHVVFTIKRKKRALVRRMSMVPISNTNSRESSAGSNASSVNQVDSITERVSNLQTTGDEKEDEGEIMNTSIIGSTTKGDVMNFKRFAAPASVQPKRKKNRKRTRDQMMTPVAIAEEQDNENEDATVPMNKKPKLVKSSVSGGARMRPQPDKAATTQPGFGAKKRE